MSTKKFYLGTGRRKTAVARVRICEGTGKITINHREFANFFPSVVEQGAVVGPLQLLDMRNRLDVYVNVKGGGPSGQAGATSQGVARALKNMFGLGEATSVDTPEGGMAKKLRDSGFLTRDSRMKERKKYGRKGARRSFQFSKR